LVIIDELPHEAIWRRWLASAEGGDRGCRVLIQAKHPERVTSDWVRAHLIGRSFRPEWGSVELVRASLALLAAAVSDPLTQRFAFASESCIPIRPLAEAMEALWASEKSWLHAWNQPQTGNEQHNQNAVDSAVIPRGDIWKSDQWVMLTRKHAEAILALPAKCGAAVWPPFAAAAAPAAVAAATAAATGRGAPSPAPALWTAFSDVFAADELYYATVLSLLGYLFEPAGANDEDAVDRRMLTYVDWPRPRSGKSPRTYERLDQFVRHGSGGGGLSEAQRLGCVFARKFPAGSVDLDEWCVHAALQAAGAACAPLLACAPLTLCALAPPRPACLCCLSGRTCSCGAVQNGCLAAHAPACPVRRHITAAKGVTAMVTTSAIKAVAAATAAMTMRVLDRSGRSAAAAAAAAKIGRASSTQRNRVTGTLPGIW
jgi:hypothetical protein